MAVNKGTNITGYVFPNIPGNWSPEEKRFALALRGLFDQLYTRTRGLNADFEKDSYDSLKNRPMINGVVLKGNRTTSELGINTIPSGGGLGKVLTKESFDDYDVVWMTDYGGTGMFYVIAPNYATLTFPVSKGQHCIHDGYLFTANQDISTSEEWTAAHWDMTDVGEEIETIKSALNDKLDSPETAGTSGQVLTSDGQGGQSWETPSGSGGDVTDVQVNGVSVVTDGVANIPCAGGSIAGTVRVGSAGGLYINPNSGVLQAQASSTNEVKTGTEGFKCIVPSHQHESTFYGLAKAAGDSTQSASSNAVGNYTDSAKDKIMKMLGIIDMIAPYESTGVASRAYATGECFIQNGKLFRATTNIVIGESFSSSNCEQTTLMDEITR